MDSREQLITPLEKIVEIRATVVRSLKKVLDAAFSSAVLEIKADVLTALDKLVDEQTEKLSTEESSLITTNETLKNLVKKGGVDLNSSEDKDNPESIDNLTTLVDIAFDLFDKESKHKRGLAVKYIHIMRTLTAIKYHPLSPTSEVVLKYTLTEIKELQKKVSIWNDEEQRIADEIVKLIGNLNSTLRLESVEKQHTLLNFLFTQQLAKFNVKDSKGDAELQLIKKVPTHLTHEIIHLVKAMLDVNIAFLGIRLKNDGSEITKQQHRDAIMRLQLFECNAEHHVVKEEKNKQEQLLVVNSYLGVSTPPEDSTLPKSRSRTGRALLESQLTSAAPIAITYAAAPIPPTPFEPKPSTLPMPTTEQKADSKPEIASIKRLDTNSEPKQEVTPPSPLTQLLKVDQEPKEVKDIKESKEIKEIDKTKFLASLEAHKEQLRKNLDATLKKDSISQELKDMFAHDLIINTYRLEQIEKRPNIFDPDRKCLHLEMQAIHQLEKLLTHFDTFPAEEKFPTINTLPNDLDSKEQDKYAERLKNYANQQIKIIEQALKEIKAREEEIRKKRAAEGAPQQAEAEEVKKANESKRDSTSGGNPIIPKPESITPRRNASIVIPEVISQPIPHKKLGFWKRHPTLATLGKIVVGAIAFGLIGVLVYAVGPAIAVGTGIIGIGAAVGTTATVLFLGLKKLYNYCKPKKVAPDINMEKYPVEDNHIIGERQSEEFCPAERTEQSPPERTLSGDIISPRGVPLPTPRKHVSIESKKTDDELLYQKLVELFYPGNLVPTDQDKIDRLKLLNFYAEFKCSAKDRFVIKESEVGGDPDNQASFKIPDVIFHLSQRIYENNQRILTKHSETKTATQMLEFLSKNLKLYFSDYAINSSPLSFHSSLTRPTLLNKIYTLLTNDNMPTITKIQALDSLLRKIKLSPTYRVDIQYSNFVTKLDVDVASATPQ